MSAVIESETRAPGLPAPPVGEGQRLADEWFLKYAALFGSPDSVRLMIQQAYNLGWADGLADSVTRKWQVKS